MKLGMALIAGTVMLLTGAGSQISTRPCRRCSANPA